VGHPIFLFFKNLLSLKKMMGGPFKPAVGLSGVHLPST
jgi:hypothetical protein